jgi:tetratricopeptide (TPR) repeat protein
LLDSLAEVHVLQHNYKAAEETHNSALAMRVMLFGNTHPSVATSYFMLRQLMRTSNNLDKAFQYTMKFHTLRVKLYGKIHPKTASSINLLGGILHEQEKWEEAIEHYLQALNIYLQVYGETHDYTACALHNLGQVFLDQGNMPEAIKYLEKALGIRVGLLQETPNKKLSETLEFLSIAYSALGDEEKAIAVRNRYYTIINQLNNQK